MYKRQVHGIIILTRSTFRFTMRRRSDGFFTSLGFPCRNLRDLAPAKYHASSIYFLQVKYLLPPFIFLSYTVIPSTVVLCLSAQSEVSIVLMLPFWRSISLSFSQQRFISLSLFRFKQQAWIEFKKENLLLRTWAEYTVSRVSVHTRHDVGYTVQLPCT